MDTIEELRNRVKQLEKLLKEEKDFRDTMNKALEWERGHNKIECDGLKQSLCNEMSKTNRLTETLHKSQSNLLSLQGRYRTLSGDSLEDI